MRSHSVTCHPAEVTFPPLPQPKLVLDLATPEGCKAELTWPSHSPNHPGQLSLDILSWGPFLKLRKISPKVVLRFS